MEETLSKARLTRVSRRPAWGQLVKGSSPVWHTCFAGWHTIESDSSCVQLAHCRGRGAPLSEALPMASFFRALAVACLPACLELAATAARRASGMAYPSQARVVFARGYEFGYASLALPLQPANPRVPFALYVTVYARPVGCRRLLPGHAARLLRRLLRRHTVA